jgi:hypothetical protein
MIALEESSPSVQATLCATNARGLLARASKWFHAEEKAQATEVSRMPFKDHFSIGQLLSEFWTDLAQ